MKNANNWSDICTMSLRDLSTAYLGGSLSPVEVTKFMLKRIEDLNPSINAIYYIDEERALAQAKASEQRYLRNESLGLFDGVPTTIKDAFPIQGMPSFRGCASTVENGLLYDWNAPAVDRLLEAGSVILGKNTMCDLGIIASGISSKHGITRNPWSFSHTPGGSSSGAAASVAAGFSPATLGSDIVGSIRLPASYCGLVGLKPSQGRVPYYFPNSPALVAGPLARNTHDIAAMMDVITQPDRRDFTRLQESKENYLSNIDHTPTKPKVRLIKDLGFGVRPSNEVIHAIEQAAKLLAQNGAYIEEKEVPKFCELSLLRAEKFYRVRTYTELNSSELNRQPLASLMYEWTRPAANESAESMMLNLQSLQELREATLRLIENFDFLILPATPTTAFSAELTAPQGYSLFDAWCNNFLFNLSEQPAISINCGYSKEGLPIGLQIVGKRFDDMGVLQMARLFELINKHPSKVAPLETLEL